MWVTMVCMLKARMRSWGCLVPSSFHVDQSDADHSWQLTQLTCRAFSILKIMQSPLSVQEPPAVLGLPKNKFIWQCWGFSFLLFQQHQVTAPQTHTRNSLTAPGAPGEPLHPGIAMGSKTLSSPFFSLSYPPLTLTGPAKQVWGRES